jgi:hypothetical protein
LHWQQELLQLQLLVAIKFTHLLALEQLRSNFLRRN